MVLDLELSLIIGHFNIIHIYGKNNNQRFKDLNSGKKAKRISELLYRADNDTLKELISCKTDLLALDDVLKELN